MTQRDIERAVGTAARSLARATMAAQPEPMAVARQRVSAGSMAKPRKEQQ